MTRRHNSGRSAGGSRQYVDIPRPTPALPPEDANPMEKAQAMGWSKGQLLNVRNAGTHYNVTLNGEEYDPRHPERCLQFANPAECQTFVSQWYQQEGSRPPGF